MLRGNRIFQHDFYFTGVRAAEYGARYRGFAVGDDRTPKKRCVQNRDASV
ncbi:hypothetical protein [Microcoleus asticus]|uniref:Uncharacterized protein n=1 Tax=Microcoleus asticus IPMA8 TaxID=2563858 RepID=A0ABX2CPN5_9CYAN|nr:hypothetical protein [Microcoleus asticus]NQE32329.1 hypothetical protein [Microcoleus asticus IPMA8]